MKKDELIEMIVTKLYYKPYVLFYKYLGVTEEKYDRISNLRSWLKRQNLTTLNKIYKRLSS